MMKIVKDFDTNKSNLNIILAKSQPIVDKLNKCDNT